MTSRYIQLGSILIFTIMLTSGCASMVQQNQLSSYNSLYSAGSYSEAAKLAIKEKGNKKSDPSCLLLTLQAAAALRNTGEYEQSILLFDECDDIIKYHNEQLMIGDAASTVASVLINDAVLDYRGQEYDGIMVNTYKALNFWKLGKNKDARVEFNRALERQGRAKDRFAAMIAKQKEEIDKKQAEHDEEVKDNKEAKDKEDPHLDFQKNINNPEITNILKEKYSNLYESKAYPDFVNPFTTYMAGLFFMSEGDYKKAVDLLKETYGMVEDNPIVLSDFDGVDRILEGKKIHDYFTWIVFENGLGPEKEEFRVDLPILLFTDKVKYTGIALPKLKLRDQAYPYLEIKNGGQDVQKTRMLADMDRVVQTEFKKNYPAIVTRAIVSTLIKTYGQYMAQKKYGDLGGFAAGIFQAATTSADIRSWTSLPKDFQLAKIPTPKDGSITLASPSGDIIDLHVRNDSNSLIYIKIPAKGIHPVVDTIYFGEGTIAGAASYSSESKSDLVLVAQEKLKALGYDPGSKDGVMGGKTKRAIALYQTDKGLRVTQRLDQNTIESLDIK